MSLGLLARQPLTWDSEAASYILQVEAADGQSLEPGVARAINTFVIDCKTRGIWGAIKSCCLLSGARTLNGALRPLKGTAPTNFNFTNSDYNRETGLKGNGTNQYLDTNFSSSSLELNNIHFCINLSSFNSNSGPSGSRTYIADFASNAIRSGTGFGQFRVNDINLLSYNEIATTNNFIGISRANSNFFTLRLKNNNIIWSSNSSSSNINSFRLFGRYNGVTTTEFSDGRISFYSIGENLDLRLLEQCIEKFLSNLIVSMRYNSSDIDVQNYLSQVEFYDQRYLENSWRLAVHNFVTACKNDNLWNSIKQAGILAGSRSLRGSLVPLIGPSVTNINFFDSDYNRRSGLLGNGTNKRLITQRAGNADPQDDVHISAFVSATDTTGQERVFIGGGLIAGTSLTHIATTRTRLRDNNASFSGNNAIGFCGGARNGPSSVVFRNNNTTTTNSFNTSSTPSSMPYEIFANNNGSFTNARLAFYSLGTFLDLTLLNSHLSTLMSSLNSI